jgi:hypothetical protein
MGRDALRGLPVSHRHCELVQARQKALHSSACSPANGGFIFRLSGRPNHERSSPPLLTVLLLLTGGHQEEGEEVKRRRGFRTSGRENPGVFFWSPPLVLALGCSEVFCACLQGTNGRIHATEIGAHIPYRSPTQRDARAVPYETQAER